MKKCSVVIAVVITVTTLTQKAEAGLFDSIGTIANAIGAARDKKKTNSGQVADSNSKAITDKLNQETSPQTASSTAATSQINAGNEVNANVACIGQILDEQGNPRETPEDGKACAESAGAKQEQQATAPAENIKKALTKEDVQREIDAIYADPGISDANKAVLKQIEAKMPPNATPEQYARVLRNYRAVVAKAAEMPQQSASTNQAQSTGALEGAGALFGGMAASRAASQSAYNTAISGHGNDSTRAVLNQVGNGGGSGGAGNGVKAELMMEGAKAVGGFIGSLFKKAPASENAGNANGSGN